MARSRNIKPAFFKNEALAECSPLSRLLFAGLWCLADREGRLEDRPKRIRAELLPYDDGSVDAILDELQSAGFILRYIADGKRFIQVLNFAKHQNPHHREVSSIIPAPCQPEESPELALGQPEESPELAVLIPDSLNLIPDSKYMAASPDAGASTSPTAIASTDPKKRIFDLGVSLLTQTGETERSARTFLGRFAKEDQAKLGEVLGFLSVNPKISPKSYIAGAFKPQARGLVL